MSTRVKRLFPVPRWREATLILIISLLAGLVFYKLYGLHNTDLFEFGTSDVWFQSDLPRNYHNMTNRWSTGHYRTKVHPLLSLLTYSPTFILKKLGAGTLTSFLEKLGYGPFKPVKIVSACIASLWVFAIYALMRITGCLRLDALLFTVLGACSSAAIFFLSVPESYALGSISIALALSLAAWANYKTPPQWAYVAISSLTLSVTITNWMVGIFTTFVAIPWRRAFLITLIALSVVTLLWGVEKYLFPHADFFIGDKEEAAYMFLPHGERILSVLSVFIFHTIISPAISIASDNGSGWPVLSVQTSLPGSAGILDLVGSILWIALLALGIFALFKLKILTGLRIVLGLSLIGQLTLHIFYGEETFLYSLHFLPLLLTLAALATLTHLRVLSIILTAALIPVVAANNWLQFKQATALTISPRQEVINQIKLRPQDPWPRSVGHVVLAIPGSKEKEKAYLEPGGNFSPGVGTLGISVWLNDLNGELVTTSDTIRLDEITQLFDWSNGKRLPQIQTDTKYYSAVWGANGWGTWQLKLHLPDNASLMPSLLIRSVGPAGGPIRELHWNGQSLLINKRWSLVIQPTPKAVYLGQEGQPDWKEATREQTNITSQSGWAFARIELDGSNEWTANVHDEHPSGEPALNSTPIGADFQIDLPDENFSQSLNAQIAHLMMGLVGAETRPGEPTNYPLPWQRDGAYVLVALARAGKLETAQMLSTYFAENDFFGGFGPEADAPGLSIWALETVANQLHRKDYDEWLWPHIYRKATYIEKMLTAHSQIHEPVLWPIVPKHRNDPELGLVTDPARNGLIVGRMDNHRPILYINAVSYRGLLDAAELAARLDHFNEANRWTATAVKIKDAWEKAFKPPLSNNDRTYISALWPSWVAGNMPQVLQDNLDNRWSNRHDSENKYKELPLWTYFELAEAHNWLFIGRYDRVWSTIQWFWNHQTSPGLYTWWEGQGEENNFGRWKNVRGWFNPPNVTPHYWTAAEMALLQMDMLGYLDKKSKEPTLVIGAGIPTDWLSHNMSVHGLRIGAFELDWHWDGKIMKVVIHADTHVKARLGSGFPTNADLVLTYQTS